MPNSLENSFVPVSYVQVLYEFLLAQGIEPNALLGEPPALSASGLDRFPILLWQQQLQTAAAALANPLLPLHLAERISPSHFGILGYVFLACGSVAGALQRLEQYHRLIYDANPMQTQYHDGQAQLIWGVENGRPGALVDETAIAALVQFCRNISARPRAAMERVDFISARPENVAEYEQWFGCPVNFDQPLTRVVISAALLATPLRSADASLIALLEQQANKMLEQLQQVDEPELLQTVRKLIAAQLREGEASAERVAAALHISSRQLHRKLSELQSNFRDLLQEIRQQLAYEYLADPRLKLTEIAFLLGYSEQSAFSRSFKQWTGQSPLQYRRQTAS